ncbi:MAG: 3-oxoacyl-[acyl-carrier protein] reductase [Solirubrobacteraceae bacterium]|nr:3-oxoacyl-[acyl-carrier protein] reductase [Solirubrobacteraceae bacterium]
MDLGLSGRVALVTGGSKGIGRAIAEELLAEGASVAISSRSAQRTADTAAAIGATAFAWDTTDLEAAPRLLRDVEAQLGPIDVLVTNTGGPPSGPDPLGFSPEQWEEAYRSLVLGPMALIERVVPAMRRRGWGRILNVASTTVHEPVPALMLSNSHRAAMLAAFKTVSSEVAADGVTLNTVLPGRISTDRLVSLYGSAEAAEEVGRQVPAGRLGTVQEMAAAAAFLVSDRASYITGQWLAVDGGVMRSI